MLKLLPVRCLLLDLAVTLDELVVQNLSVHFKAFLARCPKALLVAHNLLGLLHDGCIGPCAKVVRSPGVEVLWEDGLLPFEFSLKAYEGKDVVHAALHGVPVGGGCHFIVYLGNDIALLHSGAVANKHGAQYAALEVGYGLGALRAYHAAFGMGDLVDFGKTGPDKQNGKEDDGDSGDKARADLRPAAKGCVHVTRVLYVVRGQSLQGGVEGREKPLSLHGRAARPLSLLALSLHKVAHKACQGSIRGLFVFALAHQGEEEGEKAPDIGRFRGNIPFLRGTLAWGRRRI